MSKTYSIGEFAKKTMTTIRTLHYYDEIGILHPSFVSDKGRRYYNDTDIITLQKIISLKFLGYSLEEISELMISSNWDLKESLQYQKQKMLEKKAQIEQMINTLDHALHLVDDNKKIDPSIFIFLIHMIQNEDAQKEWLKTIFEEDKVQQMYLHSDEKQKQIEKSFFELSSKLKDLFGKDPGCTEIQQIIYEYIQLTEEVSGMNFTTLLEDIPENVDDDPWLFPSPFTKEEEEWLAKAFEIYLTKIGVNLYGK
ncbi:MerR family transcriptional regulator [Metabacillus litoralis]|uniref:MerR family transcriptional regulator n=1 Tax=Metabacillus litoralis TaxID=152268 RepID=UPI001CFC6BE9|nr:MerR family transcriptional regulator [Metabacillus litoralis]